MLSMEVNTCTCTHIHYARVCVHVGVCACMHPSVNVQSNTDEKIYIHDISWHPVDIEDYVNML